MNHSLQFAEPARQLRCEPFFDLSVLETESSLGDADTFKSLDKALLVSRRFRQINIAKNDLILKRHVENPLTGFQ